MSTPHCNALQHTATHCNTLQHTATHCNTLQHTATRWRLECSDMRARCSTRVLARKVTFICTKVTQNHWFPSTVHTDVLIDLSLQICIYCVLQTHVLIYHKTHVLIYHWYTTRHMYWYITSLIYWNMIWLIKWYIRMRIDWSLQIPIYSVSVSRLCKWRDGLPCISMLRSRTHMH